MSTDPPLFWEPTTCLISQKHSLGEVHQESHPHPFSGFLDEALNFRADAGPWGLKFVLPLRT